MSPENCKRIQEAVKEAGAFLDGKLPPHPGHARRNPYAHLHERIIAHFGWSYKELKDEFVEDVLAIIKHYRDNPC